MSVNDKVLDEATLLAIAVRVEEGHYDFDNCATANNNLGAICIEDVAAALFSGKANYTQVARLVGRSRSAVVRYIEGHAALADLRKEIIDTRLDKVEEHLYTAAEHGDAKAGQFVLKTIGKDRGYTTRTESTGKDGVPLAPPSADFSKMSAAALKELRGAMTNADEPG